MAARGMQKEAIRSRPIKVRQRQKRIRSMHTTDCWRLIRQGTRLVNAKNSVTEVNKHIIHAVVMVYKASPCTFGNENRTFMTKMIQMMGSVLK